MEEEPEKCFVCGDTDTYTNQGTDQSADQSNVQSANQGTDQSADQSNVQSANQGTDQSNVQSANQGTDQSADQSNVQSTNQGTDQSADQSNVQSADQGTVDRVNSSTTPCANKGKKLYPKIHFCGKTIWICSTCIIKRNKCKHCKIYLQESQLFTDLTKVEERENRIILGNGSKVCKNPEHEDISEKKAVSFCSQCECMFLCQGCSKQHCKMEGVKENKTKYHILKHIEQIKECTNNKNSSPCVLHTDAISIFFCCTHNVPVCLDCRYLYHKTCTVNRFTESLDETRCKLQYFDDMLESKITECDGHLQMKKSMEEAINRKLTDEFEQLRLCINDLERDLKNSVKEEYKKECKNINWQKDRVSKHQQLIRRVLHSPPDVAFFDMTHTLAASVNSIEKDISELKDVKVQMAFQKKIDDLEEAIKSLKAMKFVSRESSQCNLMGTTSSKNTVYTSYSSTLSVSGPRGSVNINEPGMSHETKNVVYVYTCTKCHKSYVGQTGRMLKERDSEHRSEKGIIYEHICEQEEEEEKKKDVEKRQKHFTVSCVRKDLVDEDQRLMMERLIMLKLGTLQPDGINEKLPLTKVETLGSLRFNTNPGTNMELLNDGRTAIKKKNNDVGSNSCVFTREPLISDNYYEVLLEEVNNEKPQIGIMYYNANAEEKRKAFDGELPTGTLPCRLGFAFYGQCVYVYVNGVRTGSIRLEEIPERYCIVFFACSKITGLPIQPQKNWEFSGQCASDTLKLSESNRTAICQSEGRLKSQMPMKVNILYEVIVDELYDGHNELSSLGISITNPSTEPWLEYFPIELTAHSHYGVTVDTKKNLHLFVNGERKQIIKKCVTLPCFFFLRTKCLKVSTLPETSVFFNKIGKVIA